MSADLYETLGVARDADTPAIKRAYKKKRSRAHPDKGGSEAKFRAVVHAHAVLTDQTKRAHYDRTGEAGAEHAPDERGRLLTALAMLFLSVLEAHDPDSTNLLVIVRQQIRNARGAATQAQSAHAQRVKKRERALKRLRQKKPAGVNVLEQIVAADIAAQHQHIARAQAEIEKCDQLLELVDEYEYDGQGLSGAGSGMFMGVNADAFRWDWR